jgi:DedD protein
MVKNPDPASEGKGLSTRQLFLVFLVGVAVCGVFFSLGFLVGFNERSGRISLLTQRILPPATIPPTVNAPLTTTQVGPSGPAPSTASVPPPIAQAQPNPPASQGGEQEAEPGPGESPPSAAKAEEESAPGSSAAPAAGAGQAGAGFTVQVVASRTKQDAEALVKILQDYGYPVFLVTPEVAHASDNLYRVQVGPFTSKEEAEKVRQRLAQEGFKPFIRR